MSYYSAKYVRRAPPPLPPETADDKFQTSADIVAELKRLGYVRMARRVQELADDEAERRRYVRSLVQEIHELRERLGLNTKEERHNPQPPPEASD